MMFNVRVEDFEGPLDLLLFLIRSKKVNIFDIPIARITDEYLDYVQVMETVDLDGVADFIYLAAMLMSIKARMLLPRPESDSDEPEADPRLELVERLLEYQRYKEAAAALDEKHEQRGRLYTRGHAALIAKSNGSGPVPLAGTELYKLVGALRRVLTEVPPASPVAVVGLDYSVDAQRVFLAGMLREHGTVTFREAVDGQPKGFVIATFLAALEMAHRGRVVLESTEDAEDFVMVAT